MNLREGTRLALLHLRAEKLKGFFGLLGVAIGVTFLIVVVSVVEGLDRYITEDFARQVYGVNTVTVRRQPSVRIDPDATQRRAWARRPDLTAADADAIERELDLPARIGVESSTRGTIRSRSGRTVGNVRISAASPELLAIRALEVERGRPFTRREADRGVPVVVLGRSTADSLFPGADPVGRTVRIAGGRSGGADVRGERYRVTGVLEEQGSVLGVSLDNRAIAPLRSPVGSRTAPRGVVEEIVVQAEAPGDLELLRTELEAILRIRHRLRPTEANDFELETAEASLTFWNRLSRILLIALPGLVGISLVVGGLVITNIMLISVVERTREIGIRKAVGARRRDVLTQVLIESGTLSGIGGIAGVVAGGALAAVVRGVSPLPVSVPPLWAAIGLGLGVGVGVAAGLYPAARAARLDPVDALRHE